MFLLFFLLFHCLVVFTTQKDKITTIEFFISTDPIKLQLSSTMYSRDAYTGGLDILSLLFTFVCNRNTVY